MYKTSIYPGILVLILVFSGCKLFDGDDEGEQLEAEWSFTGIEQLTISTVSGDCMVQPADDDTLRVDVSYTFPESCFEPRYSHVGSALELQEVFSGVACNGSSHWVITIPDGIDIEFSSASGNLTMTDHQGGLDASTASGEISLDNVDGAIEASTASGKVDVSQAVGELQLSSASGDVDCEGVAITAASSFSSASGDVSVVVAESPSHDVSVSSASGRAVMNYNGNPVTGTFVFTARQDLGTIVSPYTFDSETTFTQVDVIYDLKTFIRGGATPSITIATASGTAELRLN
ncbi:MAG: DUF4097 family beta strand repeat protein [Fidelibacterota bacterium]|nr:MAG: DUF4097 family beta strand repeat protein [Candidatus Neomarinimicrobiota bacterium]